MKRFWDMAAQNCDSRAPLRDAFISLESELYEVSGIRRYKTYGSFRVGKHRQPKRAKYTQSK
jgi:hypothetical protein